MKGYEWLQRAMNGELEPRTIIKTEHESQYFDDHKEYDYYIYHKDNMFHRCNEKGQLGAKFQDRFLNYKVLNKTFSYYCVLAEEDKKIEKLDVLINILSKDKIEGLKQEIINCQIKINELIDEVNKLKEGKDE